MTQRTPGDLLRELRKLKDRKKELEAQETEVNKRIVEIEQHLFPEAMERCQLEKISEHGIGSASLGTRVFATVLAHNKPAFLDWLKDNGHAALVKEDIHQKTLESFGREILTEGLEYPDELVTLTAIPVVNFRRS